MHRSKIFSFAAVLALLLTMTVPAFALEVEGGSTYCFSADDFARGAGDLSGICITAVPDPAVGTVMLGNRTLRSGDILTVDQVEQMTFCPLDSEVSGEVTVRYLPVFADRVEEQVEMTISIRGRQDQAPVAQDMTVETYKNLSNEAALKVSDPEGEMLTFTVTRQPRRGTVTISPEGNFTYTPARNKVGMDSFTFTATDPKGNVSREATVTVRILKPTDSAQYRDTAGLDCRFEAEWLRSSGLFEGEKVGGELCFNPEKTVSRREFVTMVMDMLEIPPQEQISGEVMDADVPQWLRPYVAAALRSGLLPTGNFMTDDPITAQEAAEMLSNVLDREVAGLLPMDTEVSAMEGSEIRYLTRADAAKLLYSLSRTDTAGLAVYRQ